ncbi:MAG: hypothetical protein E6I33_02075 [Chloroflexi bacterium]|nr:MAG: hypothetical protein E6I33_02075 [Chloroflexota bacterium]
MTSTTASPSTAWWQVSSSKAATRAVSVRSHRPRRRRATHAVRAGPATSTNGSQFFICTANDTTLPKSYNLFGNVASGMTVALQIAQGDVMQSVVVSQQQ